MRTILVVDDDATSRELLRTVLEGPERSVLEARDGQTALDLVEEEAPDLVLLDISLPVLDGFAVLRGLKENPRRADSARPGGHRERNAGEAREGSGCGV